VLNLKQQLDSIPVEGVKIQPMIIDQFSTVVDRKPTSSQAWKGDLASFAHIRTCLGITHSFSIKDFEVSD